MPDPLCYLAASGTALAVAAMLALAAGWSRRGAEPARVQAAGVVGIAAGLAAGYGVLQLHIRWPPLNGLDRFLTVVLPLTLIIELTASIQGIPRWLVWAVRAVLTTVLGRILLHDSVYLHGGWTFGQAAAVFVTCAALTVAVWTMLVWLAARSEPRSSIPLALALTIVAAGATILLSGYLAGGAACLPLGTALIGSVTATRLLTRESGIDAAIGVGVVGLSSLLLIGHFFGRVSTGSALALLLAPLLCWATELPVLRRQPSWVIASLRLLLVGVPLIVVLVLAKQAFDRDTLPLLTQVLTIR